MITKKDQNWMIFAKKCLKLSKHPRYRLVAILTKARSVVDIGCNKNLAAPKPYQYQYRPNLNLHAEIALLNGLKKSKTKGSTMYIAGQTTKSGASITTKPCPSCLSLIVAHKVGRVVYLENEEIKEMKL